MIQRILVPVDSSQRAERAIAVAAQMARNTGSHLVLLRTVTPAVEYYHSGLRLVGKSQQTVIDSELEEARSYLAGLSHTGDLATLRVETVALAGLAAETILAFIETDKIDLVVMCSHGSTGFKRWALGSVAQYLVRHSHTPILMLHAGSPKRQELIPQGDTPLRALIALDGSHVAEAVLRPTIELVAALAGNGQGEVHLMQAALRPTVEQATEYDRYDDEVRQRVLVGMGIYLHSVRDRLNQGLAAELGVKVVWSVEESTDVAQTLIRAAELGEGAGILVPCDLLAQATHGYGGWKRLMMGCVTERVLAKSQLPLLIVRPQELHVPPSEDEALSQLASRD